MAQVFLIGIGAGAATALLFASVASGSPLAVLLFYLAPLPILIAALGWSQWAGLIAATAAAIGLASVFGGFFFIAFLIGVGLPAWWLGYLALLARPVEPGATSPDGGEALEWYPAGQLVLWAALLGAGVVIAGMVNFGTDEARFQAALREGIERMLRATTRGPADPTTMARLLDLMIAILPPAAAVIATLTNLVNLWLAARVTRMSNRLRRPPDVLAEMRFPSWAPILLGGAFAGTLLPGLPGIAAGVLAAALLMAYAVLGFAVVHALTRPLRQRGLVLGLLYAAVLVFAWPIAAVALLGLADSLLDLRGRFAQRPHDPSSHP